MARLLKLSNHEQDNTKLEDPYICLFQFGNDWQKYEANEANKPDFSAQFEFGKTSNAIASC